MKNMFKTILFLFFMFVVFIAKAQAIESSEDHDYVDLGLPSGTFWATCNIGANAPEEAGDYFSWGEVSPKTTFYKSKYLFYKSITTEPDANGFTATYSGFSKYVMETDAVTYGFKGYYDNLSILEKEDDAANVLWGESWKIPTWDEMAELIKLCKWDWVGLKGMDGYKVTGPNGNYIFLPVPGCYTNHTLGDEGRYWSSSLGEYESRTATCLQISKAGISGYSGNRYYGYSIRPVCRKKNGSNIVRCATPIISYSNGHLSFNCDTEGVKYEYSIDCQDAKSGIVSEGIDLNVTYTLTVYAIADGYERSESAKAILCWFDAEPKTEGMFDKVTNVAKTMGNAILIQEHDGMLNFSGVESGTCIRIYNTSGMMVGKEWANGESTSISANLRKDEVAIVKIGDKSVKIIMNNGSFHIIK